MIVHERFNEPIPGTTMFDGKMAMKGYALNRMCYSFNEKKNRDEFLKDEDAYCKKYGLNAQTAMCWISSLPAATSITSRNSVGSSASTCRMWAPSKPI